MPKICDVGEQVSAPTVFRSYSREKKDQRKRASIPDSRFLAAQTVAIMRRNGMKDQRKRAWVESCKAIMVYVLNRLVQQFNGIP